MRPFELLQNQKIDSVIKKLKNQNVVVFKSPTGSGKTIMMGKIMNQIIAEDDSVIFLVSSLSKGGLAEQNYDSFENHKYDMFRNLKPALIAVDDKGEAGTRIKQNSNVYVLPRDLLKENTRLTKENSLKLFFEAMKSKHKKIYLIKDECHQATNVLDNYDKYFDKQLLMSATPRVDRGQNPDVQMSEEEAIEANLIKKVKYMPKDEGLDKALDKFQEIKKAYIKEVNINPCLIIQISNETKGNAEIEEIKKHLNTDKNSNLHWMYIVGDEKQCDTNDSVCKTKFKNWKKYAKDVRSTIDVVIFKLALGEGWDIPRACMLYQIRDTKSKQLDEQVIGRVRRNPMLLTYEKLSDAAKEVISTAYVWGDCGNLATNTINVELVNPEEVDKEIKIKTTSIKPVKEQFSLTNCLKEVREDSLTRKSIFKLYDDFNSVKDEAVINEMNDYVKNYSDWFKVSRNAAEIKRQVKNIFDGTKLNVYINKDSAGRDIEVCLPAQTSFDETEHKKSVVNWLWRRSDGEEEFSFDSQSEKEWFDILLKLVKSKNDVNKKIGKSIQDEDDENIYLLGKNFQNARSIGFQYYLDGIHTSYPDFIMKDYLNQIHIFESKSLDKSNSANFDEDEYVEKCKALKLAYKETSKILDYYFYIPIREDSDWTIYRYKNGQETVMNLYEFEQSMKTNQH